MARIKAVYGKRQKPTATLSASTDFWSSPNKSPPKPTPSAKNAIEDITTAVENLSVQETANEEKKLKKKHDRALQTVDGNVVPKAKKEHRKKDIDAQEYKPVESEPDEEPKPLKTPKKDKPRKVRREVDDDEPTPRRHQRRIKAKKDAAGASSINLDGAADEEDDRTHDGPKPPAQSPERLHAATSPVPPTVDDSTTTTTADSAPRRSASPSVVPTPKKKTKKPADPLTAYTKPLLRLCADRAARKAPTPFAAWAASLEPYFWIRKIAEASYGEVYRLSLKAQLPGFTASDESVLKMIALKPPADRRPKPPKGKKRWTKRERELAEKIEGMSEVASVAGEARLLRRMTHVPGFTNFRDVRVLRGAPPRSFADAWAEWNEGRPEEKRSIFPDPGEEGSYDEDQLWAVVEMQDAGTDLENVGMAGVGGVFAVWDCFWSVALALGKGEEEARFEHRDLHMGNICVRPAHATRPIAAPTPATHDASALGRAKLNFTGLESTIIDYTLSRAQMTHPAASPDPDEAEIAFLDLEEDPLIFEGDADEEYQYEIYRHMRGAMYLDDPLADVEERWDEAEASGRTWCGFHPQTNLVWLHFILHEMMKQITLSKSDTKKKNGKKDKEKLPKKTRRKIVYDSDEDDEQEDGDEGQLFEQVLEEKRRALEKALKKVQKLLDPKKLPSSGLHSVKDLVALALEEEWLDEEDVVAASADEEEGSILEMVKALDIEEKTPRKKGRN